MQLPDLRVSIHGSRFSQPFPSFLPQFGGGMQRELLLHPHLMCLDRFDAHVQFSRQFRNAHAL